MGVYTESLEHLIAALSAFPGVGKRTAERYAFHVLRSSPEEVDALRQALHDVKAKIRLCCKCFQLTEKDPCEICSDAKRDTTLLCVVEQPKDVIALEKTASFRGLYHVLLGRVAPLENCSPEDLTLDALFERLRQGGFKEVILATNPTLEGEGTALHIAREIEKIDTSIAVTRIARGMPRGSSIEFASKGMLYDAIEGRTTL